MLEIIQANYFGSAVVLLFLGGTTEQYLKNRGGYLPDLPFFSSVKRRLCLAVAYQRRIKNNLCSLWLHRFFVN